jgi:hypothetical protein
MKIKILYTTLPVLGGILVVLGLLFLIKLMIYGGKLYYPKDIHFFTYVLPLAICVALVIQYYLTLPIWEKFKSQKNILGLTLFWYTVAISLISGLAFGFVFWDRCFGIGDLISTTLTGVIAFAVYWTINLILLKLIDNLKTV